MKIGIITFCRTEDNYGQVLQCFALQEYLRRLGHKPFLIQYDERKSSKIVGEKRKSRLRYITHFQTYFRLYLQQKKEAQYARKEATHNRHFSEFIGRYITKDPKIYDCVSIMENPPKADAYICGSDQIWGGDLAFYLNFVPIGNIKIAYAPSFGGVKDFSEEYRHQVYNILKDFSFVGMREQSGVETCRIIGREDAVKVCDPTLLLSKEHYSELLPTKLDKSNPYIVLYLLGSPSRLKVKDVYKLAASKGWEVKYVASQGQSDAYSKEYVTIQEWVSIIHDAELVITNSFHGTVFSLIHSVPFITVPLTGSYSRMNTRVTELLSDIGLSRRILKSNLRELLDDEVDFSTFKKYQADNQRYVLDVFLDLLR